MLTILFNFVGILSFVFITWKRLKEDYVSDIIFNSSIIVIFFVLVFYMTSSFISNSWWFWFVVVGILFGLFVAIKKFKLRVYEVIDAYAAAFLPWLSMAFLSDFWQNLTPASAYASLFSLFLLVVYVVLDEHYHKFVWYKSGRVGFSGLTVIGILFLTRAVVALSKIDMLSLTGKIDVYLSSILAFVAFINIYHLSRKKS